MPKIELIQGDCLEKMKDIPDGSIDMALTSPPYDNLRTYNGSLDWGEHVWKPVIQELFRIVKDGGVVVWVVGDATINGSETGTSFKQALWAMECGFNLHDTMIYAKDGISFPDANRYQSCYEYMFVWSKASPHTKNLIADRKNISFGRKITGTDRNSDGTTRRAGGYGKDIKEFGLRWNIWNIPADKGNAKTGHPAKFPDVLAHDHILSWSNEGDVILDPFAGSGTVGKMAKQLNRNCILIEKDPAYCEIAEKRIEDEKVYFFEPLEKEISVEDMQKIEEKSG
jgi:site-specific DNA-methyltransferase (adenine-specific)